jgi:hypothetical protein
MKKIIVYLFVLVSIDSYSQNTIPTTTCTGTLRINDSLNVNKNIVGKGEITAVDTLRAKKDIIVDGNAIVDGKLKVSGKSTFKNDITIKKSILFDGNNEFSYTPATATSRATFYLGNTASKTLPWVTCPNPNTNAAPQFINTGAFISRVPLGSGNPNVNSALSFFSAPWDGTGVIEVDGVDNNNAGNNGLLINYYCGRNTGINVGWDLSPTSYKDGGTVYMGAKVDMQSSLKLGWSPSGNIDLNTSIEINQNGNNANGVKLNTWNNSVKAFSIERADGKNTFVMYGSGDAYFGINRIQSNHAHANAPYQFDGKIACKELVIVDPTKWADFVFEKNYKLLPLAEVEKYINENKHLPSVPSEKEVKENGINTAEMDAILLQKIEELTLYIMQQQKDIDALKKEIKK